MSDKFDIRNKKLQSNLPDGDFSAHKKALKEAIMQDYVDNYPIKERKSFFKRTKVALSGGIVFAAMAGLLTFSLVTSPLTAQKVLAEAQASSTNLEQGRYRYTTSKITDSYNGKTTVQTVELWEDLETGDSRMVSKDSEGKVIDTFVAKEGKFYTSPVNFENMELIGQDGEFTHSFEIPAEALEIEGEGPRSFILESNEELPEGVEYKDIELIDVNGEAFDLESLPEDLQELIANGTTEDIVLDSGDLSEIGLEGIDSDSAVAISVAGPMTPDLTRSSNTEERKKLYEKLIEEDGSELIEQTNWEGREVVGVRYSDALGDSTISSAMYFDANSYAYVGSEFDSGDGFSFKDVVVEESYSNDAFDLSTEGLEELDFVGLGN